MEFREDPVALDLWRQAGADVKDTRVRLPRGMARELCRTAPAEFTGPGARNFLNRLLAGRIPKPGRLSLTPMLTPKGKLYGDLTVAYLDEETFYLFGSGAAQEMHRRWFDQQMGNIAVTYRNRSGELHGIGISGPKSQELLSRITRDDVSSEAFKLRDIRRMAVGGVPSITARLSFSGELGYEIYVAPQYQIRLFEAVEEAGADLGLKLYGAWALMSLRLEKNWGAWGLDFRPDFTAAETSLDAFIDWNKGDFIGRTAASAEREAGPKMRLVSLVIETDDIDVSNDEAIFHDGVCVGYVTSGGYAHHADKSMAMGYIPAGLVREDAQFGIEIMGEIHPARLQLTPLHDPIGGRMRG